MYLQDEVNKSMKEKNKRFSLFCGYELVLKEYGVPGKKECY